MNDFKSRRNQIYIGGNLQGGLVKRIAICWVLYHVVLFNGLFAVAYLEGVNPAVDGDGPSLVERYESFAWQNRLLIFGALAAGPVLIWDVIRCTHRVAGPLVRLENTLLRMAKGETIREIKFRDGDWVGSLERALNAYLTSRLAAVAVETQAESAAPTQALPEQPQIVQIPVGTEARVVAQGDHDLNELLRELRDINETLAALNMGRTGSSEESSPFAHFAGDRPRRF
jgi:methyl-accepting chemotaxis protein